MNDDAHVVHGGDSRTLPMSVHNTGFMLDRLGKDCSPLQFLRELTQNAAEAIAETPKKSGEIVWDVDWISWELGDGEPKLACIDTGVGMSGEEMLLYINKLSSSTHTQSYEANYGVGAKVAAATRNHAGLVYISWRDGVGSMIHLWRDPSTGQYGLKQFPRKDGTFSHWVNVEDSIKPPQIKDHGTMVILLGNEDIENTMLAPKEATSPSAWIVKYLNTRYFQFPPNVRVKARELRGDGFHNALSTVTGQKSYLSDHSQSSGSVPLMGATAHWWILKDEKALGQRSGYYASSGHVAALHHSELYELVTGRSGTARLQLFGVIFGYSRVAIYVEPDEGDGHDLVSNTARTQLLLDGEALPWADWAAEFRSKMPGEIRVLMEEVTAGSTSSNHKQSIKERLKQIRELFRISRYRKTRDGNMMVSGDTVGGTPKETKATISNGGSGSSGGRGGRAGDIYVMFAVDDGEPGEEIISYIDPDIRWVTAKDGTRTPPDLEDRAAKYLAEENVILINRDFRGFKDMVDRWYARYSDTPGSLHTVEENVYEWFEQALTETVLGIQSLKGSQEWSVEDVNNALSEEALTAAVMQRYHIDNNVKRALGAKLGSLKDRAS